MDNVSNHEVPVLIVGGSLVGLSAAVFLSWRGVPAVLVEPHAGSHPHPRAIGYTARTLELYRSVGLSPVIPEAPANFRLRRCRVESLAGKWFEASDWTPEQKLAKKPEPIAYSRHTGAAIAQDRLEPLLRDRARALGADLRLGTELVRFAQDATGITAWLREGATGREYSLRTSYMIAADGSRSAVREALGISQKGPGHLQTLRSVLFRAPLESYLEKGIMQFEIEQPDFKGFLTTYADGRWVLMLDDVERDEKTWRACIDKAIGRSDLPVEIITNGRWDLTARIADRFTSGRVFLAGDAAHTLPPTRGGFGANTGIHDAHNLAWKLAAVLAGDSTPALLDTYDAERRPVAWGRLEQTFARPDYAKRAAGFAAGVPILDEAAMEFGQLYRSAAVIGASEGLPPAARPDEWQGQPGTRAPHLWVERAGERLSTLDLFERGWVLLTEDARWIAAAKKMRAALGIAVEGLHIGVDLLPEDSFPAAFGIAANGASLIRPDGFVAWRSIAREEDPTNVLAAALATVTCAAHG